MPHAAAVLLLKKKNSCFCHEKSYISTQKILNHLLVLLWSELAKGVGHSDVQLFSAVDNSLSLEGGNIVCNLGAVSAVVHHQHLEVLDVGHGELVKTVWQDMASLLVTSVANVHLFPRTLELSALTAINTLWLSP